MATIPIHVSMTGLEASIGGGLLPPQTIIGSRYRVIEAIGSGGMGSVYLGEHLSVGRKVAIKVLHAEWSALPAVTARFEAEARTASAIGHPGIIDVLDAGALPDGRLYLVMEYLAGRDLDHELAEEGPLAPARACRLVRAVAQAIAAAHTAGVVHRDLKPDNILVTTRAGEEVVKVLDFGIAADRRHARLGAATTAPGTMIGTPEHMSPEQAIGDEVGPHFDIYALGSLLFTLLDGEPPFVDDNPLRLLARKQSEPAPSLADRVDDLPAALVALVADALAIDIDRRPASAEAFIRRLDEALAELDPGAVGPQAGPGAQASASAKTRSQESMARTLIATSSPGEAARARLRPGLVALAAALTVAALIVWAPLAGTQRAAEAPAPPRSSSAAATPLAASEVEEPAPAVPMPAGAAKTDALGDAAATSDAAAPSDTAAPSDAAATSDAEAPAHGRAPPAAPAVADAAPPSKRPATRPARRPAEHLTPRCEQLREQTRVAREAMRWATVLQLARERSCWARSADARKLETQARMETGDFTGCVAASSGLQDSEVSRWRELCRKRGGLG